MNTGKNAPTLVVRAYTPEQVAEMLQEKVEAINRHCRTQVLKGAYKTGGKTSPCRIPPAAIDHYQRTRPRQ
ncbi:helix-turn-helix domain-containing protein [Arthrobacter sp. Sr24]